MAGVRLRAGVENAACCDDGRSIELASGHSVGPPERSSSSSGREVSADATPLYVQSRRLQTISINRSSACDRPRR